MEIKITFCVVGMFLMMISYHSDLIRCKLHVTSFYVKKGAK